MSWHHAPQAAHSTKEKIRIGAVPFTLARFCNGKRLLARFGDLAESAS
jgi:hypothetical protein